MNESDITILKGLIIMMISIITFMILDGLFNIPFITIPLSLTSGLIIALTCKKLSRKETKTFRATLILGLIFFFAGNIITYYNANKFYYDINALYFVTIGMFLSSLGMIIMFSSIPIIIIKDYEEHQMRVKNINS